MRQRLFLLSNSTVFGRQYLEHALAGPKDVLGDERSVLFVPYAVATANYEDYTAHIQAALVPLGAVIRGVHTFSDPRQAVTEARVLYVGGGNSFRLLKSLQQQLLALVRGRVEAGELRYIGASAGTNVACPSVRTTNDMPIVQPRSFKAFGLLHFQINPHYLDPDPTSTHQGETRPARIAEFLEENDVVVLGMREGSWLQRNGSALRLEGIAGARLFLRHTEPQEIAPGTDLSWLLEAPARFDQRS